MSNLSIVEETTIKNKQRLLEALEASLGIVSTACNAMNISRQTHYNWMRDDELYREAVEELADVALDFAESQLMRKIRGVLIQKETDGLPAVFEKEPSDTAIIFYLKTKGKKRGYVERQELTGAGGEDLFKEMTDDDINKELDRLRKIQTLKA